MVYPKFDENKAQKTFDGMFGKGAFNSGMAQAREVGRTTAQAKYEKDAYAQRIRDAQSAAKKAATAAKKKSYNDALAYWNDPANKTKLKQQGADRNANNILNDPNLQAQIKSQGYKVDDYVNALYNAASDGKFHSAREYKQYVGGLKKDVAAKKKDGTSTDALINQYGGNSQRASAASQNTNKGGNGGGLSGLFNKLKNSEVGLAAGSAFQAINPFDNVSADDAIKNYLNHKPSKTAQEVQRGANRAVDSASLGLLSNLDKKVNNREPYYNSQRKFGEGGGTDMITSGLGYLVPGLGAAKAAKGTMFGAKSGLTGLAKLGTIAKEGAAVGGAIPLAQTGINYALNPKDQSLKDNALNVLVGAGLGAVGDPLLHGAGQLGLRGLSRFAKGDVPSFTGKPSQSVVDNLIPKNSIDRLSTIRNKPNNTALYDNFMNKIPSTSASKLEVPVQDRAKFATVKELNNTKTRLAELAPKVQTYQKEFDSAVKQQYDYLKNSMGKGVQPGGLVHDQEGYVTGAFGRVSNNPKWYQDFYAVNNRKPNNKELWTLAEEHVRKGFADEGGNLPAWKPQAVREIDNQIDELTSYIRQDPAQEPVLRPILNALNDDRATALKSIGDTKAEYDALNQKYNELGTALNINPSAPKGKVNNPQPSLDRLRPGRDFEPITAGNNAASDPGIVPMPVNHNIPYKPGDPLPNTLGHIESKTKKELPSLNTLKTNAYIKTVDNLHTLNQFDKTVEKVLGRNLKPSESSYTLGLNSRGSDQISKQILTQNMVNKSGDVIGPSLKEIASKIPKNKLPQFEDYLINKHAITRMNRGEKVFPDAMQMNVAKSEAKVKQYEAQHPEFKALSKQYYEYNKQLGKTWLVDEGILSEKTWNQYLKANPNYVPNNRIFKDIEKKGLFNVAKKDFANQSDPTKNKAVGSQRPIVSPIESTIEHTDKYVKTAKRNEVMQSLIHNIKQDPEAFKGWAEIVPTKETPQDIVDILNKDGVDGVLEHFNTKFDQKPDLTKGNVVFGLVDGKKVHVKVHDPQLLDALTNLEPKAQHAVVKAVGQLTRKMKVLTTGINPVFSLTRNIWRDIPTAYINSKTTNNPLTFSKDLISSVISVMKNSELYRSFKAVGGGHSSPISSDANLLAQSKRAILPKDFFINGSNYYNQKSAGPIKKLANTSKYYGGKLLGGLETLNNVVEAAPRLAEFKRLTKNNNSYDAKMKGLFEANDVTTNFNKHGNFTKELDAFVPYLNAAIQGLDKTYRSVQKGQRLKTAVKGFTAITVPSIVLYAVNHNNPDYQKLSNYIKDNNFLIPNGDGTFTKIPKPRELGPVFGSSVERLLKMWNEQDPKAFEGFGKTILDNFLPPTRTVLHPALVDTVANKNFAGVPIVPGDLQNLSPKYQYDSKTSEVAKGIGNLLNVSPKKVDYLAKSYGGILGELGIPATTKDATIGDTLKQKVTADPVFSNDLMTKFYDEKTKLDQAHNDLVKQGAVSGDLNEERRKVVNTAATNIGKIRKAIKATQVDQTLTPKDRLARIRSLQQVINNIADSTLQ